MLQPLFVQPQLVKKADPEGGQLPPNVAEWPVRIRDEFAKTAPYAWDYPTEVVISERDEKRGYGFGHLVITSKSNMPPQQAMGQIGQKFGVKTAKIPVIVEDWKLYPMDLLVTEDGAILPLNESRLREALFRPTVFDAPGVNAASGMFGAVLYPPMREYGANSVSSNAVSKVGSFPALVALADTIEPHQIDRLVEAVKTAGVELVKRTPALQTYLRAVNKVAELEPRARAVLKTAALSGLRADVEMVTRAEGPKYLVKKALRGAYTPIRMELDREKALAFYGEEKVKEADTKGVMIIIRGRGDAGPRIMGDDESPMSVGMDSGPCRVMNGGGGEMGGWLFSKLRNLLGEGNFPARVWSDGKQTAMQEDIGAVPDKGVAAPTPGGEPGGLGMFSWPSGGQDVCSEPVTILTKETTEGRPVYAAQTALGRSIRIVLSDSAQDVVRNGEEVLIPAAAKWIRLGDKQVSLSTVKEAAAHFYSKLASDKCQITFAEQSFHFDGPPLQKLGSLRGLSAIDALFTCGLLGLSKEAAEKALAKAFRHGRVKLAGVTPIVPFEEIEKKASEERSKKAGIDYPFMLKTAASLGDPQSVDAILSLGFLNLDNVARAVTFVPHLEQAQRKLAILLLQSRLGLSEMPQDHLSRALTALEHVLAGLRRISLRLAPVGAMS